MTYAPAASRRQSLLLALAVLVATITTLVPGVPANARATATQQASCSGFRNRVGITAKTITLANIADVTGPVPGLYTSAQQAVRAYVRYFDSTSSICGRKLRVLGLDSTTSTAGGQSDYVRACGQAFAAVGSMSAFDDGGAAQAQQCGLPDLRAQSLTRARYACTSCFAAQVDQPRAFENAVPDFFLGRNPAATQSAALLYLNAGSWATRATTMIGAETARGWRFGYTVAIDVAAFNYGPYVQQLRNHGIRLVQFLGPPQNALRLAQAMQSAGYAPDALVLDPDSYTAPVAAAAAAAGAIVPINLTPFAEAIGNPELRRYKHWLQVVAPGAAPTSAGLFAWSAARLFTRQALALGGRLNRARLITAVRGVHAWTGNGLHAAQDVGGKLNGNCWRFLQVVGGRWVPVGGTAYRCSGKTTG